MSIYSLFPDFRESSIPTTMGAPSKLAWVGKHESQSTTFILRDSRPWVPPVSILRPGKATNPNQQVVGDPSENRSLSPVSRHRMLPFSRVQFWQSEDTGPVGRPRSYRTDWSLSDLVDAPNLRSLIACHSHQLTNPYVFTPTIAIVFKIFPPSSTTYSFFTSRSFSVSTAPDGQRISTISTFFASPNPK